MKFLPPQVCLVVNLCNLFGGQSRLKCKYVEPTNVRQGTSIKALHTAPNESRKTLFESVQTDCVFIRASSKLWPSATRQQEKISFSGRKGKIKQSFFEAFRLFPWCVFSEKIGQWFPSFSVGCLKPNIRYRKVNFELWFYPFTSNRIKFYPLRTFQNHWMAFTVRHILIQFSLFYKSIKIQKLSNKCLKIVLKITAIIYCSYRLKNIHI